MTRTPRVLVAWELGAGYGHVMNLLPLLRAFAAAGWEAVVAARQPAPFEAAGFRSLQAPKAVRSPAGFAALNLSAILLDHGYGSTDALAPLVAGWRRLFDDTRADLICAEYAPTALLAARLAGVPSVVFGMGFYLPPLAAAPSPSLQPWRDVAEAELAAPEAQALDAVNGLLSPPLARFADLWAADARFLCTWPELDHYGLRSGEEYFGPTSPAAARPSPSGPPRAFLYLAAGEARLPALLAAFSASGIALTAHLRGASPAQLAALSGPGRRLSPQPLDPLEAIADAHFVVTSGGHGLVSQALRAGRPLLLLPHQAEQTTLSIRVARQGLGFVVDPRRPAPDFAVPLRKLAAGACLEAAQALSRRRAGHDPAALVDRIVATAGRLASVARYE
jgi:UDP:flavonoid glycosyltransferase YjiC (YdhE family)